MQKLKRMTIYDASWQKFISLILYFIKSHMIIRYTGIAIL